MARKYRVEYLIDDAAMIRGETPHNDISETEIVEADSPEEAIALMMDWLTESALQNGDVDVEVVNDKVTVYSNGEAVEEYYRLTAREYED